MCLTEFTKGVGVRVQPFADTPHMFTAIHLLPWRSCSVAGFSGQQDYGDIGLFEESVQELHIFMCVIHSLSCSPCVLGR